ncbi:nitrite/sulfite reductase [Candidatus Amarobacter glycogenicus]|uniref:nitrite/sulfite reductase n=1 Tax=Candidatus Amarobacter glycogenicus TaxID=3140699 RepID=UPI002A176D2A|nr:nitrite/sulfite reductase [Dehalococcoidia bacterium]
MPDVETLVYTNEPALILPVLEKELQDFQTEAHRMLNGEWEENQFIGFRLKQGVYGQRQPNVQMIRVKLPFGGVTPEQMDAFAEVAERFAPLRKGHITTRQNIQLHHIPLAKAAEALFVLGKAGLSTREACGNTVRNVTGDPWAGIQEGELFDPTPYAGAFARFWLRNPLSQLLPRKFKVAFTGTDADNAITGIHDLGFIPRIQDGVKGFEVVVGGGLSIMARNAPVLAPFVSTDEYLRLSEAVVRIFEKADELRKNRSKARLKFLVHRVGIEEFRRMVDEELKGDWASKDFRPDRLLYIHDEEKNAPPRKPLYQQPNGDMAAFSAFVSANVRAQRQQGFSAVEVKVTRGDLKPEQFRGIATIMREYCGGYARMTVGQNIVLRWVRDESLFEVFQALRDLGLADIGAQGITDVVSCPGTDSCKLGITASMGLNQAIQDRVELMDVTDALTRKIHIKMSGCPNSCGQHHIANIGFHGAAMKVGPQQLPAYHMFVGGSYDNGNLRMATQLKVRLPAKRGPDAVERVVKFYEAGRQPGEEFNAFFDRVGAEAFETAIEDLTLPGDFTDDNRQMFIDWSRLELYQLQRGEGECAI